MALEETLRNGKEEKIKLTPEQQACIDYSGKRTLTVKGVAGSGKSVVLMGLARKYMDIYEKDAVNTVGLFTFQNTLVSFMKEELGLEEGKKSCIYTGTLSSYIFALYKRLMMEKKAPYRAFPASGENGKKKRIANVEAALKAHEKKYGVHHRFHEFSPEFWLEEFTWMKEMNVWTDDLEYYLSLPRKGRGGKIRMKTMEKTVAYEIFCAYCEQLERTKQGDWEDQALYLVRHKELIPDDMKFDHIILDEAQDFSLAQMMVFTGIHRKDMIIAMDMNQRIHGKTWTPKQLGIETTTKKLTKPMRTTKEIEALAETIRSKNDSWLTEDDKGHRVIPVKSGMLPVLAHLKNMEQEKEYLINQVKELCERYPNASIGIICARNNLISRLGVWLADANIYYEEVGKTKTFSIKSPGVKLTSAYNAKGLEFHIVLIPMFMEGNFPYSFRADNAEEQADFMVKMRNLVYVSMTRAKEYLALSYHGDNGSRFIGELSPELYAVKGEPLEGSYYVAKEYEISAEVSDKILEASKVSEATETPALKLPPVVERKENNPEGSLVEWLEKNGASYADKRSKGGALWIFGTDSAVKTLVKESKSIYGARWTYSARKSGYFTSYEK